MDGFWQVLIFFLLLVILGYFTGSYREKKHYKSIQKRERQTRRLPMTTISSASALPATVETRLFVVALVISVDSFKRMTVALRNSIGEGHLIVQETLLDRGRREALLRLKEQAMEWGATQMLNVQFETSTIGGSHGGQKIGTVEIIVYGTGVK